MATKLPPTDLPTHYFEDAAAMEKFMDESHYNVPGFYVKVAKKSSRLASVSKEEATAIALCFGWIDGGGGGGFEPDSYLVRFTPRRPKSLWSQKNVDTVARLVREERMRPAGLASVDAAKVDGRWARAYATPSTMTVPKDVESALKDVPNAEAFFNTLNRSERYMALLKVYTASPAAREGRVEALVSQMSEGKKPALPNKKTSKADPLKSVQKSKIEKKAIRKTSTSEVEEQKIAAASSADAATPRRPGLRPRR